MFILP